MPVFSRLLPQLGFIALAATPVPAATPTATFNPYLPNVPPNYPPDSAYRSLYPYPTSAAPKAAAPDTPAPVAQPSLPPLEGSLYKPGQSPLPVPPTSGDSGQDQAPIVDPSTVPREITFEPRSH